MCEESLLVYLREATKEAIDEEKLKNLITYYQDEPDLTDTEKMQLAEAIDRCSILDPACGSGAFPMGMLQKTVHILQKLDPENKQWKSIQQARARQENGELIAKMEKDKAHILQLETLPELKAMALKELEYRLQQIENAFTLSDNELDYARKLFLIENCIFGVDIQSIAIQISKLRFFISLLVEQKVDDRQPNRGIVPMPNMETKFVAANTLIGLSRENYLKPTSLYPLEEKLKDTRHKHFSARTSETKKKYRNRDRELRKEISRIFEDAGYPAASALQIAEWDPYDQNKHADWFDPEYMFGISDGFDIVIGNPPYVQLQNNGGELANLYSTGGYKTFARTGDIYCLFYERGYQLLKPNGKLCYITSNKWMRAGYGEKTRKFFAENTNPEQLIDFAGVQVFDSATVDTNILMFSKDSNRRQTRACIVKKEGIKDLSVYIRQLMSVCSFDSSESWIILSPIEHSINAKIETVGTPLKNWDIKINFGIKTGYNEAFIISGEKRKELIAEDPKSAEIIRPILRGRDIKRYGYDFVDFWLINTHNGVKEKGIKPIEIDDYPAIKTHLNNHRNKIKSRADQGDTPYNLRNCAYIEDLDFPKIVWKRIGSILRFCYDEQKHIVLDSTCFATGKNLKFLMAVLNSKLGNYLLQDSPKTGTGDLIISVQAIEPLKIPIPVIEIEKQVEKMLQEKDYEAIDKLVYEMYGLTEEEIKVIER